MIKVFLGVLLFLPVCSIGENIQPSLLHYEKGLEYYGKSQCDKAEAEFLKALEFDSNHSLSKEMLEVLKRELYQNVPSDPFNDTVKEYYEKGLVYFRKGDQIKAKREWEQALLVSPSNSQLQKTMKLLEQTRMSEAAVDVTRSIVAPRVVKNEETKKKNVKEKKALVNKKKVDDKKVSDLYYEGVKVYKQGEILKAIAFWEQVLKLDPDFEKARKPLERAKKQLKEGE